MGDPTAGGPWPPLTEAERGVFTLSGADVEVLSMTDEEYKKHDWEDLKKIIGTIYLSRSPIPHPPA